MRSRSVTCPGTTARSEHAPAPTPDDLAERLRARPAGRYPVPSVVADHRFERPDGAGLVQLAFATPMTDVRDAMLELPDAITGALHWVTEA